jgi:hypothetical protein
MAPATRSHTLGYRQASSLLEAGNLFYNERTKANYFRGIMRGLFQSVWMREIARELLPLYDAKQPTPPAADARG